MQHEEFIMKDIWEGFSINNQGETDFGWMRSLVHRSGRCRRSLNNGFFYFVSDFSASFHLSLNFLQSLLNFLLHTKVVNFLDFDFFVFGVQDPIVSCG